MDTSGETLPSPAPSEAQKRPGRPRNAGTESQQQRIERIREELREAEAALKASEEKRAGIVGAAVLRHVRRNPDFASQLATVLRAEIKAKADRATVADLL